MASVTGYGDRQPVCGEYIADMCRHVVRTLVPMRKHRIAIGNQSGEEGFQVLPDGGIGIFIEQQ